MPLDGIAAVALVGILSFMIDRASRGVLFLLQFIPLWRSWVPTPKDAERPEDLRRGKSIQQITYYLIAAILGISILSWFGKVRLLTAMLGQPVDPVLDVLVTGFTLVAGADWLGPYLDMLGHPSDTESPPEIVEVTGQLTLEQPDGASDRGRSTRGTA